MAVSVLYRFLTVPGASLQCVVVTFSDHGRNGGPWFEYFQHYFSALPGKTGLYIEDLT